MYRENMPANRTAAVGWPALQGNELEDGPLALAKAVIAAAVRNKFRLVAWIGAFIAMAAIYSAAIPPSFTAAATLLLEPRRSAASAGQDAAPPPLLDFSRAEGELQVIRSERLLSVVFEALDLGNVPELQPRPPGRLRLGLEAALGIPPGPPLPPEVVRQIAFINYAGRVGARRLGQSYAIEVSYTSSDPTLARRVANAVASAYLWQSLALKADAARNGAEFIQGRVNALTAQATVAATAIAAGRLPDSATPDADARVIGAALQPLSKSAPRTGLIVALGGVFGFISGLAAIAVTAALDRRIRTPEGLARATGLPCLAMVPEASRGRGSLRSSQADLLSLASSNPESDFAAAIRDLRTSIMLGCTAPRGKSNQAVALVSWAPNAGCTVICSNLAQITHDAGKKVTLIDTGLHPRAYRGAPEMAQIIDDARLVGEVLVDLPPLCDSADAKAAATYVDAVVIIIAAGQTTIEEAGAALQALKSVRANVIGAVLNRTNSSANAPLLRPLWRRRGKRSD